MYIYAREYRTPAHAHAHRAPVRISGCTERMRRSEDKCVRTGTGVFVLRLQLKEDNAFILTVATASKINRKMCGYSHRGACVFYASMFARETTGYCLVIAGNDCTVESFGSLGNWAINQLYKLFGKIMTVSS